MLVQRKTPPRNVGGVGVEKQLGNRELVELIHHREMSLAFSLTMTFAFSTLLSS